MDFTLSTATPNIIQNIKNLKQIWHERYNLIEKNNPGNYSRHLLLILNDLREEIQNNQDHFRSNSYGKKFFKIQISIYCNELTLKSNQGKNLDDKLKKEWTKEVNTELCFIVKALSDDKDHHGKFALSDIIILIQIIESKLKSENSLQYILGNLYQELIAEEFNKNAVIFFIDTIILLFNEKGILSLKSTLDNQFEKWENISKGAGGKLYPSLFVILSKEETESNYEYEEKLRSYYEKLTIRERLGFLQEIYCLEPQIHRVIFHIRGISLQDRVSIGSVELYCSKKHQYISQDDNEKDFEKQSEYCVSVQVKGLDSKFMSVQAKQMAERTINVLSSRHKKEEGVVISNNYVICDDSGKILSYSFSFRGENGIQINQPYHNSERIGKWISSEKTHATVAKWLSSVDWYRKATESSESYQEILNSWFAIEKFSNDSHILSVRLPKFDDQNYEDIKNLKESIYLWMGGERLQTVQLLLVLSELKFHLYEKINRFGNRIFQPFVSSGSDKNLLNYLSQDLREYLDIHKSNSNFLYELMRKIPEIKKQLDDKTKLVPELNEINQIFYEKDNCQKYLIKKIIEVKDDVYNIYRIRNMLVHAGVTKSKLFDYYAKRSREYCYSLLDAIGHKIYETSNDDEIMSLEFYFREIVIYANIAIEGVQDGKLEQFINWVLS